MPTYEYQCQTCGYRFEKFQSFSEEPLKECPQCGEAIKKVISPVGIVFKGSGWYINDSKKKGKNAVPVAASGGESTDSPASSESTSPGDAKTDPKTEKPAASTETGAAKEPPKDSVPPKSKDKDTAKSAKTEAA